MALAGKRAHKRGVGYTYLHSIQDGSSRLACSEAPEDLKAIRTIGFLHHALVFFAAHGTTWISRNVADSDASYTATVFNRSTCAFTGRQQRTRIYASPGSTGRLSTTNG